MIFSIALRELRSLFLSPLAWTVLAATQFILAWAFLAQVDGYLQLQTKLAALPTAPGVTDLVVAPLFNMASVVLLMVCPLLTMRLVSEERRSGTLSLLLSSPVSMTEIVLGKYLGILVFMLIFVSQITLMPLSLLMGADLDLGKLAAGVLGLTLLLAAFCAAGLYISTLALNPSVAAVGTFGLLLALWMLDSAGKGPEQTETIFNYLSLLHHNTPMLRGIVNSSDIVYYLLFIATFLILSIRRLDTQRLRG